MTKYITGYHKKYKKNSVTMSRSWGVGKCKSMFWSKAWVQMFNVWKKQ